MICGWWLVKGLLTNIMGNITLHRQGNACQPTKVYPKVWWFFGGLPHFQTHRPKNSNSMHVLLNPFFWWSYSSPLSQLNHYGWTPHWWIPLSQCSKALQYWFLVGGLEHVFFHSVGNFIIPTDELIFFRGVGIPPTRFSLEIVESPMNPTTSPFRELEVPIAFFWGRRVFPLTIVGSHTGWPPPVVCWFINHHKHH